MVYPETGSMTSQYDMELNSWVLICIKWFTKLTLSTEFIYLSPMWERPNVGESLSKFFLHDIRQPYISLTDVQVIQV
jgi:hypothetical protein